MKAAPNGRETGYAEDALLPLSALQHLLFCPRQCALIHIEQIWQENRLTAEGRLLHERVHEREDESRGDLRIARGLRVRSRRLGLIGQCDVVEFHRRESGCWQPYPVEFKRGRAKAADCDRVQLCAQALCLEEMLQTTIPEGALFYGAPRRRENVPMTDGLRAQTTAAARELHALIAAGCTPPAIYEKRCRNCSLIDRCRPQALARKASVRSYLDRALDLP